MKVSNEYNTYLKQKRKNKIKVIILQFTIIITFILLWQILSDKGIVNSFLCSSPKKVVNTICSLFKYDNLFIHVFVTLKEILLSFLIGSVIAIVSASILWYSPFTARVLDPYLTVLNSLPKVAFGPIIIIWAGANQSSIILMALLIAVISTILNIYTGFIETNETYIKLLKSFGANKFQILIKVIFPANINNIISSLKINLSLTFVGLNDIV